MKKLASLSLAAAVLAMTAGCSMLPQATPAPTVTVTAGPSASSEPQSGVDAGSDTTGYTPESPGNPTGTLESKTMWDFEDGKVSDDSFVAHVRANTTTLDPYDESMLIVLAQTTCAAVYNGTTEEEIVEKQTAMAESRQVGELTKEMGRDVAYLLVTGSENYCPDLQDDLIDLLNS